MSGIGGYLKFSFRLWLETKLRHIEAHLCSGDIRTCLIKFLRDSGTSIKLFGIMEYFGYFFFEQNNPFFGVRDLIFFHFRYVLSPTLSARHIL